MADKVIRDGKVAVLVSPGYGAGWSSWADDDKRDFALFDPGLVALAEKGAPTEDVDAYITEKLGAGSYFYTGGWSDIKVKWLPVGTPFRIHEYDGSESIEYRADVDLAVA